MEYFLIVGLGNPGSQYENTKHNIGFKTIDCLCEKLSIVLNTTKFNGLLAFHQFQDKKFIIAKPMTFMNNSGHFVYECAKFYKIPNNNIFVIYDDINIDVGKIKIRLKGSSGGQNGIKNIIQMLGSENIKRVKIGIGKPDFDLSSYVLSEFKKNDLDNVNRSIEKATSAILEYIDDQNMEKIMNKYNS